MNKTGVYYFGFGANASPEMMKAIIGHVPEGEEAVLYGHKLYTQAYSQIPKVAQEILGKYWESTFTSYVIKVEQGAKVKGTLWQLTPYERQLVKNWELVGPWQDLKVVQVTSTKGSTYEAETEVIPDSQEVQQSVEEEDYPYFVISKKKILKVAESVRHRPPSRIQVPIVSRWNVLLISFFVGYYLLLLLFPKAGSELLSTIITISTFLLSILIGFALSRAYSRLELIREELRVNDAKFVNISKHLTLFNNKAQEMEIIKYMDDYLTAQIDYYLIDFRKTGDKLNDFYRAVLSRLQPSSFKQEQAYEIIINNLDSIMVSHKRVSHLVLSNIPKHEWKILWLLSVTVWASLLLTPGNGFLMLLVALLGASLLYLLLLLSSINSLKWGEKSWVWESLSQLFVDLNLKPYIPEPVYRSGRLAESFFDRLPSYRFVFYGNPYPDMSNKTIIEQIGRP
jgi:hypothetical protein